MLVEAAAYVADGAVLGTYFATTRGKSVRWLHWANALGCFPVGVTEVWAHAWPPLVLTAAFGAIGWMGALWQS